MRDRFSKDVAMRTRTRRAFPLAALLVAAAGALLPGPAAAQPQVPARPHVVYILSDDQGWKDAGFRGSDIRTPTLDRLAARGAVFEQFYAQNMCTPSRAALMTGRYPFRYGLQTVVIPSAGTYGLATDEWLLPQALKDAGYATAIVGKWHLGHADPKYWPRQRGFDYQYGPLLGEIDYFTHAAHGRTDWFRDNRPVDEPGYVTELLGDDAVRRIAQHDLTRPLFLYLAFTAPHAPYQAPAAALDAYANVADPSRRAYAAMITEMDRQIGRVVSELERRGMRENTLIVFQSDNGGPRSAKFTGEVDMSKSTIPADNGPWRDGKGTHYEGGNRVTAIANWPGRIRPGTVVRGPVHVVDMYPTLTALAGAPTAKAKPLDGLDVWPAIAQGKPSPRSEVVYGIEPFRAALRQGDWKLVWQVALPSRVELYDLATDPQEKTDVAAAHPAKVAELKGRVERLSGEAVPPLLLQAALGASKRVLFGSVALPEDDVEFALTP
jgi:arylsulfatase A-like enzyme